MDLATVLAVVQTIISAIQTLDQLKASFSFSNSKDEFERLAKTVSIIQSVLEDADAKQGALNRQQKVYIAQLKDAIYDADDVLDEFITLVKRRKAEAGTQTHNYLSGKVKSFLSHFSLRIHNLSRKVKDVNKKLDDIASNSSKFLFKVDNQPTRFIKPESSSFVSENDVIIGRGKELEKVVRMLLNSDDIDQPNKVTSLAIVGMGGLGKTAFAQLVYNDPRVSSAFQLKSWTCIADQDQWNLSDLLGKIVQGLLKSHTHDITTLEQMHIEIRKQLGGKKYLLVLDDVWTENYHRWQDLEKYLRVGARGSRIVVTTRSKKTAQIVGDIRVHELQGLPKDKSWRLFQGMAFLPQQLENPDDELIKLGKEIVNKCANVPLAIRVVASLLRGEPKLKWLSFRDKELASISESDDTMDNILRLSYHQLDFALKSCFSYCAIFPKDFVIDKQMLISLWMAQGYIRSEYVGEEYFLILLQRCFFQDLMMDEWGEIRWFKIHDLLHDIAEQVAGKDIHKLTFNALNVGNKVRHLSLLHGFCPHKTFSKAHIRTYANVLKSRYKSISNQLLEGKALSKWTRLRSVDLKNSDAESLPESIGKLSHLRCLNLSNCDKLTVLPDSFTKLVNLQTLDLSDCTNLLQLPENVIKFLDLSTLNLTNCKELGRLPSGLGSLTRLHTLGLFVLGEPIYFRVTQYFDGLEDLRLMSNLKGFLEVRIFVDRIDNYVKEHHGGVAPLSNKENLKKIHIYFKGFNISRFCRIYGSISLEEIVCAQELLNEMQPHHDLKELKLEGYIGEIMPRWLRREDNLALFHLPNLVTLYITDCCNLRCLTSLGELPHLKDLTLWNLPRVEYVWNAKPEACGLSEGSSLFPSLKKLRIGYLINLKSWWPILGSGLEKKHLVVSIPVPCFAQLKKLEIYNCPKLESFPMCSCLEPVVIEESPQARVWDKIQVFRGFLLECTQSDSKSRMMSFGDFESDDIDINLTTELHRLMSRHGYNSMGVCRDELSFDNLLLIVAGDMGGIQ